MEAIERMFSPLLHRITDAKSWGEEQQLSLIQLLTYASTMTYDDGGTICDLHQQISYALCEQKVEGTDDFFEETAPLSFSEWIDAVNKLDQEDLLRALHDILVKTATTQLQQGMHPNNVLAVFSNLNACKEIKQEAKGLVDKQHSAASTIQRAWRSRKQGPGLQTDTPEKDQSHPSSESGADGPVHRA